MIAEARQLAQRIVQLLEDIRIDLQAIRSELAARRERV